MLAKVCLKRFRFVLYAALFFLITLHITDRTNSGLIATVCIWFALPLAFIAFGVGKFFKKEVIKEAGIRVIIITIFEALAAGILVTISMRMIFGMSWNFALILGAIATATAPAST
ncbi:MAG: hypothetical protein ACLTBF_06030, partial [Christensenellales bacterium]